MEEWSADFTNNPNDDFNLVVEILHFEKDIGIIFQSDLGLSMKIYPHSEHLSIPVDWLNNLLSVAQQRLSRQQKE